MNAMNKEAPERQDIEALLPWHAAGTLNRRDAERVEAALSSDHELKRRYDLIREELAETIHLNETLGAPSARAMEKLFAAIDAEGAKTPRRASFDFAGRTAEFLSGFSQRTLAWSASAAALILLLQAAVITTVLIDETKGPGAYQTASAPSEGALAVVRFAPQASAADITKFLNDHKASIVDGPGRGGLYTVRLAPKTLPADEVARIVKQMQSEAAIVQFIAAKQ